MDIVGFVRSFDRDAFDSGNASLDDWLRTQASQQERTGNTRTFLGVESDEVIGYYATTTYRLDLDEVATMYGTGKRKYPMPAVLLARLAVARSHQGRGVGATLLAHALSEISRASASVGFEVVVVHAVDDDAVTFYARHGFRRFEDHPRHLFMTTKDLRATVGG